MISKSDTNFTSHHHHSSCRFRRQLLQKNINPFYLLALITLTTLLTNFIAHIDTFQQNDNRFGSTLNRYASSIDQVHLQQPAAPATTTTTSLNSNLNPPRCHKGWAPFGNKCFKVFSSLKNLSGAKQRCDDMHSKISTVGDDSFKEKEFNPPDIANVLGYLSNDQQRHDLNSKQFFVVLSAELSKQFNERVNSGFYDENRFDSSSNSDQFEAETNISSDIWLPRDDPSAVNTFPNTTDREQLLKNTTFGLVYSRKLGRWGITLLKPDMKASYICERTQDVKAASSSSTQSTGANSYQSSQQSQSSYQQPYSPNNNFQTIDPKRSSESSSHTSASSISYVIDSNQQPAPILTATNSVRTSEKSDAVSSSHETSSLIFREWPHDQSVILGSTAELRCSALESESILTWSFNGKNLTQSNRIRIHSNGTMRIDHVRNADDGNYSCTINSNGVVESKSAHLEIIQRPHPPEYINAELLDSSSSIRVRWTPGFNGNSPIKSYILEMTTVVSDNIENDLNSIMQSNAWDTAKANISAEQTEVIIADLKPARKYIFRIRATNKIGTGDPSLPTKIPVEVPIQPPSQAPERLSGTPNSPTSIKVQWNPPPTDAHNGQLKGYKIRHKLAGYASDTDWYTKDVTDAAHLTYTLEDLIVWQNYEIQVAAENERGAGPFSPSIIVRTKEGKPDKPPRTVAAEATNSTLIRVTWTPPPPQHINGVNLGYKVRIWFDFAQTNLMKEKTVSHNTKSPNHWTIIDELSPYTDYYVTVNCFTVAGDGPTNENLVHIKTKEDLPEEVQSLEFFEILDKSLKVTWKPPKRINGELNHYSLEYSETKDPDKRTIKKFPAGTIDARIIDLVPQTAYIFKIYCHTTVGSGPAKVAHVTTSVPPVLPEPPRELSVVQIGSRNVTLGFEPGFNGNANIDRWFVEAQIIYRIDEYNSQQPWQTIYVSTNHSQDKYLVVNNLRPFTKYRLRMTPANVMGKSHRPSEPTPEFQTAQTEPEVAPKDLIVEDIKSTSMMTHWSPLPNHMWLGVPQHYNLTWFETINPSSIQYVILNDTRSDSYLVKDLEEYTEYGFRIYAVNQVGSSPASEVVNATTLEDVPSSGPNNLTAHALSSTAISVDWSGVPKRHRNGLIRGYKIQYKASQPMDSPLIFKNVNDGSAKHVTLNDLKPYTTYSLAVAAFTNAGDGVFSGVLQVQTNEDTPGAPQNISYPTVAQTSARILWDPPEEPNGEIQGYRISYHPISDGNNENPKDKANHDLHPNERTFKATNLKPDTHYLFSVTARTKHGWGQPTTLYLYTHDSELRANLPFYREGWFSMMCASLSIVITIIITALLYIQTKSYKYKQDAIKSTSQDRLGDAGFTIDEDPANHYNNTGFGLLSQNANNRRSNGTLNQGTSNYTLPKSPPRPHPGSVVYSDEGDDDVFEEVVSKPSKSTGGTSNYDSSDSLAEKPSEMVSSSTAPESESNDEEYANMANNLFAGHYANVNGALRAQKAWQKKSAVKTYASYRTKPKLPQRPAPSVPQVPGEPSTSGSSDNPASTLSLPGPSGFMQPVPRASQQNTTNGIYESRPPTIIPSSVTNPQMNTANGIKPLISSTKDAMQQSHQHQQQVDLLNNNNHIINLNGGRIIVDNMAGSRAPLPGFTSFV